MAPWLTAATIPISRVVYSVWCLSVTQKHMPRVFSTPGDSVCYCTKLEEHKYYIEGISTEQVVP